MHSLFQKIHLRPATYKDLGCLTAGTKTSKTVPLPSSSPSTNTPGTPTLSPWAACWESCQKWSLSLGSAMCRRRTYHRARSQVAQDCNWGFREGFSEE